MCSPDMEAEEWVSQLVCKQQLLQSLDLVYYFFPKQENDGSDNSACH